MGRNILISLVMATALAASGNASAMIINGGFENPDIPGGTFSILPAIPGWTAASGMIEIQDNVAGSPFEGDQFLELDSTTPSVVFQDVTGLTAGKSYALSFAFSARPNTSVPLDNVLSVKWDGVEIFNDQALTINPVWTVYSIMVTASAATNRLELADVSPQSQISFGVYVDDVRLVAAPEPAALALLGLGLAGLGFARVRSR